MVSIPIVADMTGDYFNSLLRDSFEAQGKSWQRVKEMVTEMLSKATPSITDTDYDVDDIIMAVVVGNAKFSGSLADGTLVLDTESQSPVTLHYSYKRYAALQKAYSQPYKQLYFAIKDIIDGASITTVLESLEEQDPSGEAYELLDALLDVLGYEEP